MVSKKLPYDTNGLPYDVYMGDSRPQCSTSSLSSNDYIKTDSAIVESEESVTHQNTKERNKRGKIIKHHRINL